MSQQIPWSYAACTDYGRTVPIEFVKRFQSTGQSLGVGRDRGIWFVYAHADDEPWGKHCGPYSTRTQAVDWIMAIRELDRAYAALRPYLHHKAECSRMAPGAYATTINCTCGLAALSAALAPEKEQT